MGIYVKLKQHNMSYLSLRSGTALGATYFCPGINCVSIHVSCTSLIWISLFVEVIIELFTQQFSVITN